MFERFTCVIPLEWLCSFLVVSFHIFHQLINQLLFRCPYPALQDILGQDVKPDLDLIKPRRVCRGIVNMELSLVRQPFLDESTFVDRQIVHNDMELLARMISVNCLQKGQEILGIVGLHRFYHD